jgi:hypothetical protein
MAQHVTPESRSTTSVPETATGAATAAWSLAQAITVAGLAVELAARCERLATAADMPDVVWTAAAGSHRMQF